MGKKWEAEHLLWEERERRHEAAMKQKEMELLQSDQNYIQQFESVRRKSLDNKIPKAKMNMVDFLKGERELMMKRLRPKEKKFVPFTKDIRVVDAK